MKTIMMDKMKDGGNGYDFCYHVFGRAKECSWNFGTFNQARR